MRKKFPLRAVSFLLGLIPALVSAEAHAQPSGSQKSDPAQVLYDEAVIAMNNKDYARACPKLEQVVQLEPLGIGAKFTLAECYEESGRLASAWNAYALAESAAAKANQIQRQKRAQQRGAALKPRLAQLTIVVPEAVRGLRELEIRRDGAIVDASQWNVPLPIDKGSRDIVVLATGKLRWKKTVEITADGLSVVTIIEGLIDASPIAPGDTSGLPVRLPATAQPELPSKPTATDTGMSSQRIGGLVAGGLGLVSLGIGTAFGLVAFDRYDESNDGHCDDDNQCDQTGVDLRDEGLTAGTVSTVMFVVGGVALAGGVTLFATAPSSEEGVTAKVSVGPGIVQLRGTW